MAPSEASTALSLAPAGLPAAAYVVERLVEMLGDVQGIEDVDGVRALAVVPGHDLHGRGTCDRADQPAGSVVQEDQDAPEWHEVPLALLEPVVDAARQGAAEQRRLWRGSGARSMPMRGEEPPRSWPTVMADGFDDKTGKLLHVAEDGLKCV